MRRLPTIDALKITQTLFKSRGISKLCLRLTRAVEKTRLPLDERLDETGRLTGPHRLAAEPVTVLEGARRR